MNDLTRLTQLKSFEINMLLMIASNMDYENTIHLDKSFKMNIAEQLGLSFDGVRKAITNLNKYGLLTRKARGLYFVNPYFFAKGHWPNINKMRLTKVK